ncbi:Hypothetical predicted protein [Olea europaea subsp. europaea]|uniref:Uncharacterized protein n=1 Tax=Olea europaea subsp. europaea TaxID=158383 RepID=A0A8S0U5F1_OLEEU|nr:Hypothetical predicted protein [Olea europaea subsp. europaea]
MQNWNSTSGDYVGAESCFEFVVDFNDLMPAADNGGGGRQRRVMKKEKKEYPPPISPWATKKYCTRWKSIVVDYEVLEHAGDEDDMDGIEEFDFEENANQRDDDVMEGQDVMKEALEDDRMVKNDLIVCGCGTKCNEYSNTESNSCGFRVAVGSFNPVYT